ncbi:MAG: hypothetical protein AVDCRST_MAG17-1227, partial [uncultured Solirubrobacterales bacterium]
CWRRPVRPPAARTSTWWPSSPERSSRRVAGRESARVLIEKSRTSTDQSRTACSRLPSARAGAAPGYVSTFARGAMFSVRHAV